MMKKLIFIFSLFSIIYSCSKKESTPSVTPPVVIKLSGCDSIKQGLLKTTSDTVRLVSCVSITGCDSIRLGLLESTKLNSDRLGCLALSIGQFFQGGVVAYILQPGDPGYDANIIHGLIAATKDQGQIRWGNGTTIRIGTTKTILGSGLSNTNSIITIQGEPKTSYAAGLARAYNGGGYTDWYLPSIDEFRKLFINKEVIRGFVNSLYFSSSENDYLVWSQHFGIAISTQNNTGKSETWYVRAIRSF